ncbi:MAG TPA: tetratricopeptide repeat protein [Thermoanaerobaculia bacterium]
MSEDVAGIGPEFEDLKHRGLQAIEAGRLEEAGELFDRALELAREQGDPRLIDLAFCNRAAVTVVLGQGERELPQLREILVRNADPVSCRLAAYNIARHYELTKNYKKALFYARIARERAEQQGRQEWIASSHNLMGNIFLAESFIDEACSAFETALELMPVESPIWRARILDNLGYCRVLKGAYREGYELLYESLAVLRRHKAERYQISTCLDLCFAHLETGRYGHARRQGETALRLAEALGETDSIKNALYLLGEAASLNGDIDTAREHFTRLQRDFFPDASYLTGFLLAVDVRKLINLHA